MISHKTIFSSKKKKKKKDVGCQNKLAHNRVTSVMCEYSQLNVDDD